MENYLSDLIVVAVIVAVASAIYLAVLPVRLIVAVIKRLERKP